MKKRFLSAALALAMVLTLIPATIVPASAAYGTPSQKDPDEMGSGGIVTTTNPTTGVTTETVFYQVDSTHNITQTVTRCTTPNDGTKRDYGKWYWLDNRTDPQNPVYYEVTDGIITGNNGSGQWYPDLDAFTITNATTRTFTLRSTTFTILGDSTNVNLGAASDCASTSFYIDMEGASTFTAPDQLVSLTVTSKFQSAPTGIVAGLSTNRTAHPAAGQPTPSAVTLDLTNVKVASISLTGRANRVTLNKVLMTNGVTMSGLTDMTNDNVSNPATYSAQYFSATNCVIPGAISITGDGSTVSLTSVTGGTFASPAKGGSVGIVGHGGTLTIAGASKLAAVTAKSRAVSTDDTTIGNIPSITVSGGTMDSVSTTTDLGPDSANITFNTTTGTTNAGAVSVNKGSVTVGMNVTTTTIQVPEGSLTINGPATTSTLTLGANGATQLSISGNGNKITGITTTAGDNLNILRWPAGRNNYFGTLSLDTYAKKQITGGTFSAATATALGSVTNMDWVDNANLQFIVPIKNPATAGDVALYGKDELTEAISSIAATSAATKGTDDIVLLGQGGAAAAAKKYIQINFGGNPWAYIEYNATTGIKLPTRINNTTIGKWIVNNGTGANGVDTGASFTAGVTENIPVGGVILDSTDTAAEVTKITGVSATANANTGVDGSNVRVRLNGNNIEVSGAVVPAAGGIASITVNLLTDVVDTNGQPVTISGVIIDWDSNTKKVSFNSVQPSLQGFGAIVQDGALVLNRGTGAKYTVSGNLAVSAPNLYLHTGDNIIIATVGGELSGWKPEAKQDLIDQIEGGSFDINGNRAILEAINAAQATITNRDSVTNWIATARSNVWSRGYKSADTTKNDAPDGYASYTPASGTKGQLTPHSSTYAAAANTDKDKAAITEAFTKAWIVPYLQVNVTKYNASGTMTATLTPYYRVDISGATYSEDYYYTVQPGRTLGELIGDMATSPVKVKFNMTATAFQTAVMHQDGKYAYTGTSTNGWQIYHAGTNGLGTVEINLTAAPITMTSTIASRWGATNVSAAAPATCPFAYDSLQAAIDDTAAGVTQANSTGGAGAAVTETCDTIQVDGNYDPKKCDFTMTGIARKVVVQALGDLPIKCTSQNVEKLDPSGYTYTFQLKRDVVAAGTVILAAQGTTQGTISLPATSAKVGETVTVTVIPVTGQTAQGVIVTTNNGTVIPATPTGKVNEYSFVVPSGATSITITPNFANVTTAVFASTPTSMGTAQAITGTTDNTALQGSTVPVAVTPVSSNYRTMGLTARGNNGATASVTRTGANTFNVIVPAGATTVTLTPSFDFNNGTPFTDVKYSDWASSDVSWLYKNGYTTGYGDSYHFAPTTNATRWEMVYFLYKAAGYPSVAGMSNPFKDVNSGNFYYNAVIWAANQGLIPSNTGYFNPTSSITRADVVNIIWLRKGTPSASTTSGFKDVSPSAYYAKAVSWAEKMGITNGKDNRDTFKPNLPITRQEIAKMIHVAFG